MTVNASWTSPAAGGTLDLANGQVVTEAVWDAMVSNFLHIGGTDGGLGVKGWCKATSAGSIVDSRNVTSITDVGTGELLVTWNIDFAGSGSYVAVVSPEASTDLNTVVNAATSPTAGATSFRCFNQAGTQTDPSWWHVMAVGDQ